MQKRILIYKQTWDIEGIQKYKSVQELILKLLSI